MSFLIDTDICSAHMKQRGPVVNRFIQYMGRIHVSAITVGELMTWALRAAAPPRRLHGVQSFLANTTVLDVTEEIGEKFGELRAAQFDAGSPGPEIDLLVAATALVHGLTLVTHNVQDFVNVPGLNIEDWLAP